MFQVLTMPKKQTSIQDKGRIYEAHEKVDILNGPQLDIRTSGKLSNTCNAGRMAEINFETGRT